MDVIVKVKGKDIPFSRGILAKSILLCGIGHLKANQIAEDIKQELVGKGAEEVTTNEIFNDTCKRLKVLGSDYERKYRNWRQIGNYKSPIFILIGGGTGVGTTSTAADLGYRLSIPRVIGTDTIREILRKTISKEFRPTLHESSYLVGKCLNQDVFRGLDKDLIGYESQAESVLVGVDALIERGLKEGTSMIIEGVHLLPSLLKKRYLKKKNVFFYVLDIPDADSHKNRFYTREVKTGRKAKKYVDNFRVIRKIQNYIVDDAKKNKVYVIHNQKLSKTVNEIANHMMEHLVSKLKLKAKR